MERLIDTLRDYLKLSQGKIVNLRDLRLYLQIDPGSKADTLLRTHLSSTLVKERLVSPSGRQDGNYKVVKQVSPVKVFVTGRKRRPVFPLSFPQDTDTGMPIIEAVIIREGDLITIGGQKSKGKTTLCLNFTGENIDSRPVLMGNEYTQLVPSENGEEVHEPSPRFFNRLDDMSQWYEWYDDDGDKFELLPIKEDYAEHIVKDKINIIDWINLDANQLYDIGKVLEDIKSNLGRGVAIVALQKGENYNNARGGQFVRDHSDLELLLDGFGDNDDDILLTIKGAKEKTAPIVGKTYAYTIINNGTRIYNFREVKKCPHCYGKGYTNKGPCDDCLGKKFVDR